MGYYEHIAILICIYVILSASLNLITGFAGMLNIGHVAFFGLGAYTSAILVEGIGLPWWVGLLTAVIVSMLGGLLVGISGLRLRGDYFAIATLGFGEIFRIVAKNWVGLTRGSVGYPGIPKPELFGYTFATTTQVLVLIVLFTIFSVWIMWRIVHSPFGRVVKAIREDELAAKCLGKNVVKYKIYVMMIGTGFAGIAGSLFSHYFTFISPDAFTFVVSVYILSMVVIGGMGSMLGAVVGAAILVILPEPLRFLDLPAYVVGALRQMIYALLLILFMAYQPQGLFGESSDRNTSIGESVTRLVKKIKEKMKGVISRG